MSYEVWNREDWGHSSGNPITTTITYDMALLNAADYSRANANLFIVVMEKNVKRAAKFRALFRKGKMITPYKCKHCNGYDSENCPCQGAGWNPGLI